MSKRSKKGFRKLENHELSEYATFNGTEMSGSDSEMIDMEQEEEDGISRRGGGFCCCCLALYIILLTIVVILLAMTGIYFGYNMMNISSDYAERIATLETKIADLQKNVEDAGKDSQSQMKQMTMRVSGVNNTVLQLSKQLKSHSDNVDVRLDQLDGNTGELKEAIFKFEANPPTIGEPELSKMRENMADFNSHLESYDSQLTDARKKAGDATLAVTKIDEKVQLFERNLTRLKTGLEGVKKEHTDTASNLDLLSWQVTAIKAVLTELNETLLQEVNFTHSSFSEGKVILSETEERVVVVSGGLRNLTGSVQSLDTSLSHLLTSFNQLQESVSLLQQEQEEQEEGEVEESVEDGEEEDENADSKESVDTPPTDTPTNEPTIQSATTASQEADSASLPPDTTVEPTTAQETVEEAQPSNTTTSASSIPTQPAEPSSSSSSSSSTTEENVIANPLPESTSDSETTTPEPSASEKSPSNDETSNEHEEVASSSTPSPLESSPIGTQMSSDSSTVATEDIPNSQNRQNSTSPSSSSSSEESSSSNEGLPEEQPPTVDHPDNGRMDNVIERLNSLLINFSALDSDQDGGLEYNEFTQFAQDSPAAHRMFNAIDVDTNDQITPEEISSTIQALQQPPKTTEASENVPVQEGFDQSQDGAAGMPPPNGSLSPLPTPSVTHPTVDEGKVMSDDSGHLAEPITTPPLSNGLDPTTDIRGPTTGSDSSQAGDSEVGKDINPEVDEEKEAKEEEENGKETDKDDSKNKALVTLLDIQSRFSGLDMNGDNRLSDFEFSKYFKENNKMVSNIFSFLDSDGSFFVTHDELNSAIESLEKELVDGEEEEEETEKPPEEQLADYLHGGGTNF